MKITKLLPIAFLLVLLSCGRSSDEPLMKVNSQFSKYVSSFTHGEFLSVGTRFTIRLRTALDDSIKNGQMIKDQVFSFQPQIAGKTIWVDNQSFEFIPDKPLLSNTIYKVTVNLGKILDMPKELQIMEYEVKTLEQDFIINDGILTSYADEMRFLRYENEILTADLAEAANIEKMIEAKFNSNNLIIKWNHDESGKTHRFFIDSIPRQKKGENLQISLNGKQIGVDRKLSKQQKIPGIDEFVVMSINTLFGESQTITIRFSDPLQQDQDISGLVYLSDGEPLNLSISGNAIIATTYKSLSGTKTLIIEKSIKNALSYKMKKKVKHKLIFESIKPAVRLIGNGTIMPAKEGLIFPFEAVNLNAVDIRIVQIFEDNVLYFLQTNKLEGNYNITQVGRLITQKKVSLNNHFGQNDKWKTYKIDISKLVNLEPGAIYRIEIRFRQEYSLYACYEPNTSTTSNEDYELEVKREKQTYDDYNAYYYDYDYEWDWDYEDYNWQDRDNPCKKSYYNYDRYIAKNVLVSNIGIIAKSGTTDKHVIVVSDIITAKPLSGAKVTLYNFQRQKLTSGSTDGNGFLVAYTNEKPHVCVVEYQGQKGYLRMSNYDVLPLSNFNIGGMQMQEGMKGFIYGERGVWRPGDDLYLSFILEDKYNNLPDNYPIKFSLYNPSNQLIETYIDKGGLNGFYHFHTRTADDALTGDWLLKVQAGGAIFSRNIKIEAIKPNRLRAKIDFKKELISPSEIEDGFDISASWLHGSVAANLEYDIKLKFNKIKTVFPKYDQYNFDDIIQGFNSEEIDLGRNNFNEQGIGKVHFSMNQEYVPGFLNAVFTTRVFESSGDFSILTQSVKYSHFDRYVGGRMLSLGRNDWYDIKKTQELGIVMVDKMGKPLANKQVQLNIYKVEWRWWWETHDNLANYISSSSSKKVISNTIKTGAKGTASIKFKLPYTNWRDNGRYIIVIADAEGNHQSSFSTYFSEYYGSIGGVGESATILAVSSNKDSYLVDEEAEIVIPSSEGAVAIVSLEKGSEVFDIFRVPTQANETRFNIKIKDNMAPGIYVHISLLQPHAQSINDNPIRMYGILPLDVVNPKTKLKPIITMNSSLEPEKSFSVEIKEETGKEMTYTLAIVDEGLLDITAFKTPDPWTRFYSREALQVRSWDLYDQIIGAYGAKLDKAIAIGGGDNILDPSKSKTQRFKPVVIFSGPHSLDKGSKKIHKFTMPNYVGSVRVMVVAGQNAAYGSSEKSVPVKKDLMLLSTLPRVLGPDEFVNLPITVFSMDKNVKSVKIKVTTNQILKLEGNNTQTVNFEKPGEKIIYFPIKVKSATGKAIVKVEAIAANLKASSTTEVEVRNPNQPQTLIYEKDIEPGQIWKQNIKAFGLAGTNSATVEFNSMIPINLNHRLDYLIRYPYGCLEQTVSSVFPQLFLDKLVELTPAQRSEIQHNINEALLKLRNFQLPNGAFSYWPGHEYVNNWATNYVGHFLIEAHLRGYVLPADMLKNWTKFQSSTANSWSKYDYYGSDLDQAYRLFLLAKIQKPETSAMNRLREFDKISVRAQIVLAGAYALTNQKTAAFKLLNSMSLSNSNSGEYRYDFTYGSYARDLAFHVMVLKILGKKVEAFSLIKNIAEELNNDQYMSTQTSAMSLMAVADFFGTNHEGKTKISLNIDSKSETLETDKTLISRNIMVDDLGNHLVTVKNLSNKTCFVKLALTGTPAGKEEIPVSKNLQINIVYQDLSGRTLDPEKITQGTDFYAHVTVTNTGYLGNYRDLALTQIFPSGWEIINNRLFDLGDNTSTIPDYKDIRDDRISYFFHLNSGHSARFTVMLNAAYIGKFYLPAVQCGAMYDNRINAVVSGKWVEVVKR